jgi:HAD superfamily phosphoserine phosphatase-like hydrolase
MKILVTEPLHEAGITALRQDFDVEVVLGLSPSALMNVVGDYDAIITRSGTPVTSELLEAGAPRLKVVGRAGIGVDNVDVSAATAAGIPVVNAPNGNVSAAAEHTIALLFALCRNVPQSDRLLREGVWGKNRFLGVEVAGKTLGIVGLGKVGTQVARRARALDMEVIAYDPFVPQRDVPLVHLDDLLRQADFVSLHVPLTPLTNRMVGLRELGLMKESAFLINCARGKVVDEEALYNACMTGDIAGAALDVFENEPLKGSRLLELTNVIVTPHLGGTTHESMWASAMEIAAQVKAALHGEFPAHIVNPEVLEDQVGGASANGLSKCCPLNEWRPFERVVFDCDSTLSRIEGIDELAAMNGVYWEVAEMTRLAMSGKVAFEEVFDRRLELIRPTEKQLHGVGDLYVSTTVEDAVPAAAALNFLGIELSLVSGGYRQALITLADKLGVHHANVYCNDLRFTEDGQYVGYDTENPLCRTGGKAEVVRSLRPAHTLFLGDGASDIEVIDIVDLFVGYGGIEKRGAVQVAAPVYLHGESLAPVVIMAAGLEGVMRLVEEPRFRPLVVKGLSMLMREGTADSRPECRQFFNRIRRFCMEGICN